MKNFIELLEREGGHIVILIVILLICIFAPHTNSLAEKAGDLALGALLLAMKGSGNKPDGGTPITKTP